MTSTRSPRPAGVVGDELPGVDGDDDPDGVELGDELGVVVGVSEPLPPPTDSPVVCPGCRSVNAAESVAPKPT